MFCIASTRDTSAAHNTTQRDTAADIHGGNIAGEYGHASSLVTWTNCYHFQEFLNNYSAMIDEKYNHNVYYNFKYIHKVLNQNVQINFISYVCCNIKPLILWTKRKFILFKTDLYL